jgi:protein-disulfide isomerase
MNPLENEIREVLKHLDPPAGFTERVISQARVTTLGKVSHSLTSRSPLMAAAIVIVVAVALVGAAGLIMTRCASACSFRSSTAGDGDSGFLAVAVIGGHSLGPEKARIVLEEFGDYECPSCGAYYPIVEETIHRFPDQLRFEYHHFPLTGIHANALGAAMAAEAAGEQDHFWEMHDLLYQHQAEWAKVPDPEPQFLAYAERIGLDLSRFKISFQSPGIKQLVMADITRGKEARIGATPTFFVNGKILPLPATASDFKAAIESQLSRR